MTSLRPPHLGPIVGHTTDTTSRIWIRAGDPADSGAHLNEDRRTLGVLGIVNAKGRVIEAFYFRLHREFDRTGTFVLGADVSLGDHAQDRAAELRARPKAKLPPARTPTPLTPETSYRVRVGTLTLDDPLPNAETLPDWQLRARLPAIDSIKDDLMGRDFEASEAVFRTLPPSNVVGDRLTFLLGSCRYPGMLWKVKEADQIFGPMLDHVVDGGLFGGAAHLTLMVGDQVYADRLHRAMPLLRADTYEEFQSRYHEALSGPNLNRLLRTSPTYMILDDHEIEDNWTQDRLYDGGNHALFNVAISAYMSYQWSHGPRSFGRLLYYRFEAAGYPFFVLDGRTQRFQYEPGKADGRDDSAGLRNNHLLGRPTLDPNPAHEGQLSRLLNWLEQQQAQLGDVPKFVVSANVFVPNAIDERLDPSKLPRGMQATEDALLFEANRKAREASDSWAAFPGTRLELLRRIVERGVQNVVFLSGDVHCSNVAEIRFEGTAEASRLRAFSVTSSAFYWPFPFADGDPNSFVHDSKAQGQQDPFPIPPTGATMHYRSFAYTQEDNFCRLDVDKKNATLTVRVYDHNGVPVEVASAEGRMGTASVLKLAKW